MPLRAYKGEGLDTEDVNKKVQDTLANTTTFLQVGYVHTWHAHTQRLVTQYQHSSSVYTAGSRRTHIDSGHLRACPPCAHMCSSASSADLATLQEKWEKTEDKPAAVAVTAGGLLVLITLSSIVDTIVSRGRLQRLSAGFTCVLSPDARAQLSRPAASSPG